MWIEETAAGGEPGLGETCVDCGTGEWQRLAVGLRDGGVRITRCLTCWAHHDNPEGVDPYAEGAEVEPDTIRLTVGPLTGARELLTRMSDRAWGDLVAELDPRTDETEA
jgi:hypothetical protein